MDSIDVVQTMLKSDPNEATFLGELFPFQQEDVERVLTSKENHHLIANEMGTGKTYEAIAIDVQRRQAEDYVDSPTLVIAPLSTISGWKNHFEELTNLKICAIEPKKRDRFLEELKEYRASVFICHWESLRLMPELAGVGWWHVIADEVHKAKNRKARQTVALKKIKAKYKLGLSGTPIVNRPDELWSILNWMFPKEYRSYWRFYNSYIEFEIGHPGGYHIIKGTKNMEELRGITRPLLTRRTKKEVLKDLPEKYYTPIEVPLSGKQRRAYDQMRKDMIAWIGENEGQPLVAPVVISKLVRLQQLALAYGELEDGEEFVLTTPSAKLDVLKELLQPGEKTVVFTQYVKMINLVEQELQGLKIDTLHGGTSNRGEVIERFQEGDTDVLLCSIGAGGVGITLTAASRVIFLDRSWSPAMNLQAEDRLHRIGQENAVQVVDLIGQDTVDLGRMQRLDQKWQWIRQLLDK